MQLVHYSDHPDDPIFFYGGPLSNFVGGPFIIESTQPFGVITETYKTVEHFFQASKAKTIQVHLWIAKPADPWECKRRGNSKFLPGSREELLRPDWDAVCYEVMKHGLRAKFQEEGFREYLLSTGNRFIAEDSPTDFKWGIRDEQGGLGGQNLLGRALMELREEITLVEAAPMYGLTPAPQETQPQFAERVALALAT